jgi:6,7-dimethyl-8-ribityllumazine synthase
MKKYKILIVLADFYEDISSALLGRAKLQIPYKYAEPKNIKVIKVPGVFEIPVTISKNIKKYDAFIALGCVIKGETPHFDFISSATTNAIMKLSVDSKKPIGNGIITCLNRNQAEDRINKALGAVNAVISVLEQ